MSTKNIESYVISAVSNSLVALELLSQRQSVGVTELSTALDISKNRAFRILATLLCSGYIIQDTDSERYSLSPKLGTLIAKGAIRNETKVKDLAQQIVNLTNNQPSDRVEIQVAPTTAART